MTRLQVYRAFLAAMSPSAKANEALKRGFYVEPPGGGVCSALSRMIELEPASTHLVLGGIGSGKTSELLSARRRLRAAFKQTGDQAWYCDVSQQHDLTASSEPGVLLALTGLRALHAAKHSKAGVPKTGDGASSAAALEQFANGYVDWRQARDLEYEEHHDYEPPDERDEVVLVSHKGVIQKPTKRSISWRMTKPVRDLRQVLAHHLGQHRAAVMLFDSLDRLPQPADFKTLVQDDIRALKNAGVGVVVVGPIRFMVGNDRSLADLFDHTHFQLATDPQTQEGMRFLCEVLRRRGQESGLLAEECFAALATASGGVLRDLMALAKRSAEEAYAAGHPSITVPDVERASEAFGRSLALGLDDDQLKILRSVAESGAFVVRGERELSLLETRRILLYPNRRDVHPTLKELLSKIPETSS